MYSVQISHDELELISRALNLRLSHIHSHRSGYGLSAEEAKDEILLPELLKKVRTASPCCCVDEESCCTV